MVFQGCSKCFSRRGAFACNRCSCKKGDLSSPRISCKAVSRYGLLKVGLSVFPICYQSFQGTFHSAKNASRCSQLQLLCNFRWQKSLDFCCKHLKMKCLRGESNLRPSHYECAALPAELLRQKEKKYRLAGHFAQCYTVRV